MEVSFSNIKISFTETLILIFYYVAVDKIVEKLTERLTQLPLSRIKSIMKLDTELNLVSSEAVFLITRATELFLQSLARESYVHTMQSKKKTIQKKDVDLAISSVNSLVFLDGWHL